MRKGMTAAAGAATIGGLILAVLAGVSPLGLLGGLLIGAGCALLATALLTPPVEDEPTPPLRPVSPKPQLDDLLRAVDDPLLLVEGQTVASANAAALATLGAHVVGEDIRLAIRHPAAAELLARCADAPGSTDLVGLVDRDRHWTLSVQPLGPGIRVVRLADRSSSHAAERMRVDFVANASHELRTPLASLIGFIETLEDADGPNDAAIRQRFLKIMAGEARRMQRLVDDLISLSRIEADKHRAPAEAVTLAALARETADAFGDNAGRIALSVEEGLPAVTGDRAQLSQLLHNLVGNAIKYGDPAKPVRIAIARASPAMIRLAVSDEGDGIAPEHLPRLTERFYRVDAGRSRAAGGTGLGLAIVKHIVERHRGRLDISSTKGVGTTVSVLLPAPAVASPVPAAAVETIAH